MKKFEEIRRYEPARRYAKLKIYHIYSNTVYDSFDEFFHSEEFKNAFYENLNCSYNVSDFIDISPDEKMDMFKSVAEDTIANLVDDQNIFIAIEKENDF